MSLVRARQEINAYCKYRFWLSATEREELQHICNVLNLIETAQKSWSRTIWEKLTKEQEESGLLLNQDLLVTKTYDIHYRTWMFIHNVLENLINNIKNNFNEEEEEELTEEKKSQECSLPQKKKVLKKHKKLFNSIVLPLLASVLKKVTPTDTKSETDSKKLFTSFPLACHLKNLPHKKIQEIAVTYGARFIPFSQMADALTENEGGCYEYVKSWTLEIEEKGHFSSQPTYDAKAYYFKTHYKDEMATRDLTNETTISYEDAYSLDQAVETLCKSIITNQIYFFATIFYNVPDHHAMGIRQFQSGEIEFYDPNFGIFVFPDLDSFKHFLKFLLSHAIDNQPGYLWLCPIGCQPIDSVPSVPRLEETPKPKPKFEIYALDNPALAQTCLNLTQLSLNYYSLSLKHKVATEEDVKTYIAYAEKSLQLNFLNFFAKSDYYVLEEKIIPEIKQDNLEDEQQKQKLLILKTIDGYIEKLTQFDIDTKKVNGALIQLKTKINNAPIMKTLSTIVDEWLTEPNNEDKKETNKEIMDAQKKQIASDEFISSLLKNHEINPNCYLILQQKILCKVYSIIHADNSKRLGSRWIEYSTKKIMMPKTYAKFFSIMNDYTHRKIDLKNTVMKLQKLSASNNTGFFHRTAKWRSKKADGLYQTLANLKPDNIVSLQKTYRLLDVHERQYRNKPK